MRTLGEKLDELLERQTREYLDGTDQPEPEDCRICKGKGVLIRFVGAREVWRVCNFCNGTGKGG